MQLPGSSHTHNIWLALETVFWYAHEGIKIYIIYFYLCVFICACLCIPHACRCSRKLEEDVGSHGPGITGSCEVPDVCAGKGTWSSAKAVNALNC